MAAMSNRQVQATSTAEMEDLILNISMARGMDEIMAVVRHAARRLVGADGITFVLREDGLCHYADEDAISPLWKGQRFPIESCISGWAMLNREIAVIEDIYADSRIPHSAYRPTFVRSLVMVPVREDDPIGAIGAYWATQHAPSPESVDILRRIANSAAVGMTNVALINSLAAAQEEAVRAKEAIILAMASLAETRDNETGNHIRRTQHYMRALAEAARGHQAFEPELSESMVDLLYKCAPLHDIGKVGIPDNILLKPGKLDPDEFAIMKTHSELGMMAIANAQRHLGVSNCFFSLAQEIAHTHHERWDGSGYPRGLRGKNIPLAGRLMAIADVYDALVSERVYKSALPHDQAVSIMVADRGKHFDPELIDIFETIATVFQDIHRTFVDMPHGAGADAA
ncbi:MAG: HD domain-containing protein [Rhizobiaceae bacterium]|nr:HD domain-containing protein [Rhizobiaceae bacterium]